MIDFNPYITAYQIYNDSILSVTSGFEYNEKTIRLWRLRRIIGHEIFFFVLRELDDSYMKYSDQKETKRKRKRYKASNYTSKSNVRDWVFTVYGEICLACGSDENIELDHIVPISRGGENTLSNLQPLCKKCNTSKGAKIEDYR